MIALLMIVSFGLLDNDFCPRAPSPHRHMANIAMRVDENGTMTTPLSAEVAARLVDTKMTGTSDNTIGWLYLDERGSGYVVLKPDVRRDVYVGFGMDGFNLNRPDTYTEPKLQHPLRMPLGVEVRSCTGRN